MIRKPIPAKGAGEIALLCPFIFPFFLFVACFFLPSPLSAENFRSQAVAVMDATTGNLLYGKNPDLKRPPASTTKLITAMLALENTDLQDVVTISRNAAGTPPHRAGFRSGEKVTVEKLLYAALIGSANDAAVALAEAVSGSEKKFVALMNRKAREIGARNTRFVNANGLPGRGQFTTASDLAKIMGHALRYPTLKEIIGTRMAHVTTERGRMLSVKNTNRLLWSEEDLVGGKTGYTRSARHCFVCAAERNDETIVIALLGSPDRSTLWKESEALISKGFDIMEHKEAPSLFVTKTQNDITAVKKTPSGKRAGTDVKSAKGEKTGKKVLAKKSLAKKKTKAVVKKKITKKTIAKKKSIKKNYRVAEKKNHDTQG
ncbi:MAG: D-alanyl-D-alanine carboxypeptidase family protein [Nitrospirota bacterium]